jgi:hypothetical protein
VGRWAFAVLAIGCGVPAPAPRGAPPTVTVAAPTLTPAPPEAPAPVPSAPEGPWVFYTGKPIDRLGAYAVDYWGSNGGAVFSSPAWVHPGDVLDGPEDEPLLQVGQYAVVEAPARGGYFVRDLGADGWVVEMRAVDATGSGEPALVVQYRLSDGDAAPDWERWRSSRKEPPEVHAISYWVLEIWSFRGGPTPARLFAHGLDMWALCCGSEVSMAPPRIDGDFAITPGRITITAGQAWRASAASFFVRPLEGILPSLLPWGPVKERTFAFRSGAFVVIAER